jgi:5-formyltetrahydrofolate cyclo-ligase
MTIDSKKKLRRFLRKKRRSLALAQQKKLSASINHRLLQLPKFQQSKNIAVYLAEENEVDLSAIIAQSWKMHKTIYLPVLDKIKKRTMKFCAYRIEDELTPNQVGILEPPYSVDREIDPAMLDLVLMPLVGFDSFGHRLGRGAGYYDAAFSFCNKTNVKQYPCLIGVAYEFQKVERIETDEKDVDLNKVVTEKRIY